ncbi:MAG: ATP-dependent Clp protease ATP-binding subunit, partial [Oscillospiraceae bacterium]|nr:ATP-dependent Clp protease ATP-binding subunit [Oscillospiraceae bacterium]
GKRLKCAENGCLTKHDISVVLSRWCGVRDVVLQQTQAEKLRHLPGVLKHQIIGQDAAAEAVCSALVRRSSGLANETRPIGCYLFFGPTGVGKTEFCKALAAAYFDSEEALVRFDMTEYADVSAVNRLIGAGAGYIGHDDGGQLIARMKKQPFCVLLFDEVEKADVRVRELLLQVMDTGFLADAKGYRADFRNCILIFTCNTAADALMQGVGFGFAENTHIQLQQRWKNSLQQQFSQEFLARLDAAVPFQPLAQQQCIQICRQKIEQLCSRALLAGLALTVDDAVLQLLCERSNCARYGARELSRSVAQYVELPLAKMLLENEKGRDAVHITARDDEIVIYSAASARQEVTTEEELSSAAPITVMMSSGSM